jgi:hypothetical protein
MSKPDLCSKCNRPTFQFDDNPTDHTDCLNELARYVGMLEDRVSELENKFLNAESNNGWFDFPGSQS